MGKLTHTAYLLKPEPLTMEFHELFMTMNDPFDSFHHPNTLPLDTYDPAKPSHFFTIPRELRDVIYDDLISSGNFKILLTSKKVHDEGIGILYKRRSCHLNIDISKYIPKLSLQKYIAALIQNVKIEIFLKPVMDPVWRHKTAATGKFSGSTVPRQTCRVVLLFASCEEPRSGPAYIFFPHPWWCMDYLRTLTGFSRITFEVRFQGPMTAREQKVWPAWQMARFRYVHDQLDYKFGPSTWHDTVEPTCGYLEFHPREHLEADPGTWSREEWVRNEKSEMQKMRNAIYRTS